MIARLLLLVIFAGCAAEQSAEPRYLFTSIPIRVNADGLQQCVAVDPIDPKGVWVYSPGLKSCATRASGPGLFHPDLAAVRRGAGRNIQVEFHMQLHVAPGDQRSPFFQLGILVTNEYFVGPTGDKIPVDRRTTLTVPEETWRRQ